MFTLLFAVDFTFSFMTFRKLLATVIILIIARWRHGNHRKYVMSMLWVLRPWLPVVTVDVGETVPVLASRFVFHSFNRFTWLI